MEKKCNLNSIYPKMKRLRINNFLIKASPRNYRIMLLVTSKSSLRLMALGTFHNVQILKYSMMPVRIIGGRLVFKDQLMEHRIIIQVLWRINPISRMTSTEISKFQNKLKFLWAFKIILSIQTYSSWRSRDTTRKRRSTSKSPYNHQLITSKTGTKITPDMHSKILSDKTIRLK